MTSVRYFHVEIFKNQNKEPWPGQSTRVKRTLPLPWIFESTTKLENPKSSVMPLALDCGFLSNAAVDPSWDKHRDRVVLPESTWPKIPTFTFCILRRKIGKFWIPIWNFFWRNRNKILKFDFFLEIKAFPTPHWTWARKIIKIWY